MSLGNNFFIKNGILNNNNLIVEIDNLISIRRKFDYNNGTTYFDCYVLTDKSDEPEVFIIDKFEYNTCTDEIYLLNTNSKIKVVQYKHLIKNNEIAKLYPFGKGKILLVIEER